MQEALVFRYNHKAGCDIHYMYMYVYKCTYHLHVLLVLLLVRRQL